jgi:hypothetical protein
MPRLDQEKCSECEFRTVEDYNCLFECRLAVPG